MSESSMPRISAFYGSVIALYYTDHAPPYFHAIYSGDEVTPMSSTAMQSRHGVRHSKRPDSCPRVLIVIRQLRTEFSCNLGRSSK
jgi:hypothetical protein